MSSMVERVARAILKARFYDYEPHAYGNDVDLFFREIDPEHMYEARDEARAAIAAMREPTEAMKYAFNKDWQAWMNHEIDDEDHLYKAMIDAALGEE